MNHKIAIVGLTALLGGCSTTPEALEEKTETTVLRYSENYQEIYRRVSNAATRCWSAQMSAYAAMEVDTELYSDLGLGEIRVSLSNFGTRNYYFTADIRREEDGAIIEMSAGNTLAAGHMLGQVERWATGDSAC